MTQYEADKIIGLTFALANVITLGAFRVAVIIACIKYISG